MRAIKTATWLALFTEHQARHSTYTTTTHLTRVHCFNAHMT